MAPYEHRFKKPKGKQLKALVQTDLTTDFKSDINYLYLDKLVHVGYLLNLNNKSYYELRYVEV